MEVRMTCRERQLEAALAGELDHHGARGLIRQLEEEIERTLPLRLTLDFRGVTFMDSSGIAVVLRCRARMQELGGGVTVRAMGDQPRKVLSAGGIDRLVTME